ncbi:MAG: hypothetical protein WDZ39_00140 [Candidatus Spechtbacterales bacterium]
MSSLEQIPQMGPESNENEVDNVLEVFKQKLQESKELLEEEPDRVTDLLEDLEGDFDEHGLEEEKAAIKEVRARASELMGGTSDMERVLGDAIEDSALAGELGDRVKKLLIDAAFRTAEDTQGEIDDNF